MGLEEVCPYRDTRAGRWLLAARTASRRCEERSSINPCPVSVDEMRGNMRGRFVRVFRWSKAVPAYLVAATDGRVDVADDMVHHVKG